MLLNQVFDPPLTLRDKPYELPSFPHHECCRLTLQCRPPEHFGKALFLLADGKEVGYIRIPRPLRPCELRLGTLFRLPSGGGDAKLSLQAEDVPENLGTSEIQINWIRVQESTPQRR